MYSEQSDLYEEIETDQFKTYLGKQRNDVKVKKIISVEECKKIQSNLLEQKLIETIQNIFDTLKDSLTNKQSTIIPVCFKVNQQDDLQLFVTLLTKYIEGKVVKLPSSTNSIGLRLLTQHQIKDVVLKVYIFLQKNEDQDKIQIFLANSITDLNLTNIYCIDKGLKNKKFHIIIPTFEDMSNQLELYSENKTYEKIYYNLYNSRQLFCDFCYKCLTSSIIKAYLPKEILTLITDLDYYPISYKQSVRRFMFCLEKYHLLCREKIVQVQFTNVMKAIDHAIKAQFDDMVISTSYEKFLHCILDDKAHYFISTPLLENRRKLSSIIQELEEKDILESIRTRLKKQFLKKQELKKYCQYLDKQPKSYKNQDLIRYRKKTRSDKFNYQAKPSNKTILQDQITFIIHQATQNIRSQAKYVQWVDINFEKRIRPEIPRIIYQNAEKFTDDHRKILNFIRHWSAMPITQLFKKFQSIKVGKLMFILRDLQINGIIETNNKLIKPSIMISYFPKVGLSFNSYS